MEQSCVAKNHGGRTRETSREHRVEILPRYTDVCQRKRPAYPCCTTEAMPLSKTMERKRISNPATFKLAVSVQLYGNAPNNGGVTVQEITLFKHRDGRSPNFYCCYAHPKTGKHLHFSCRTSDLKQAQTYAAKHLPKVIRQVLERESQQSNIPGESRIELNRPCEPTLLSEFAKRYVTERKNKHGHPLRKKSKQTITDSFNQFQKRIGDLYLHEITGDQCSRFIQTDQPSERTAQKHHTNLRGAFRQAQKWKLIQDNPFDGVRAPIPIYTNQQLEERCFWEHEFEQLFDAMPVKTHSQRRLRNLLLVAHETGLRLAELRHMKWSWVNFTEFTVTISFDGDFAPKTLNSMRVVPLSDQAILALRKQEADNQTHSSRAVRQSPFVFPSKWGTPISESGVHNPFRKIRSKVFSGRRRPKIHGLRHNLVTRLVLEKMSEQMIQDVTGHSSIEMVRRYSYMGRRLVKPVRRVLNKGRRYLR